MLIATYNDYWRVTRLNNTQVKAVLTLSYKSFETGTTKNLDEISRRLYFFTLTQSEKAEFFIWILGYDYNLQSYLVGPSTILETGVTLYEIKEYFSDVLLEFKSNQYGQIPLMSYEIILQQL